MVPCQPRQLVICSLPFAALAAFFWFKHRRSLSRSDPGGTADQSDPVDNLRVTETNTAPKQDERCVKDIEVTSSPSPVIEEIAVTNFVEASCLLNKGEEDTTLSRLVPAKGLGENSEIICEESLKYKEDLKELVAKEEEFVKSIPESKTICICSYSQLEKNTVHTNKEIENNKEVENIVISPDFVSDDLFNSTLIEEDFNSVIFNEVQVNNLKSEDTLTSIESVVSTPEFLSEKTLDSNLLQENVLENTVLTKEKVGLEREILDTTLIDIQVEDKILASSLEQKSDNSPQTVIKNLEETTIVDISSEGSQILINDTKLNPNLEDYNLNGDCTNSVENISTDTGLGSQDLSIAEDSQVEMALVETVEKTASNNDAGASSLGVKLASLEMDGRQQGAERDSANHSPAEVMLNSPVSTFSDAHSEGSSDSGKGCSDVATPPPRTPAGGSSVSGDQVPSVYEFVLPQVIVGRLIGRHGVSLNDIRTKSHTNIFIKRHPETNSLKICAIEGTQPDIDAALKLIRQKFPLRRYPELTLERVNFIQNVPTLPIDPATLQLQLIESVNNDVVVSYVMSAGNLCLQMPTNMSYPNLYHLTCIMNDVYNSEGSPLLPDPQPDMVCVAPANGGWYRTLILSVDSQANTSDVKFLDYGGFLTVDNSVLRQIRGDFMLLPFQALEVCLANVVPSGGEEEWSEAANQFVQSMTCQQVCQVQVYDYTENGLPLIYLYCTQMYHTPGGYESRVVLLNEELVSQGFAELVEELTPGDTQSAVTES